MGERLSKHLIRYCVCSVVYIVLVSLCVFIMWLIAGCSTHKEMVETDIRTTNDTFTENISNISQTDAYLNIIRNNVDSIFLNYKGTVRVYDTSKPVDPITSKPPLLLEADSEINLTKNTNTEENITDSVSDKTLITDKKELVTNDSIYHNNNTEVDKKSKIGRDIVSFVATLISILAIVIILYAGSKRYIK